MALAAGCTLGAVVLVDLGTMGWCGWMGQRGAGSITSLLLHFSICSSAVDVLALALLRSVVLASLLLRYTPPYNLTPLSTL
jgi:hypothetical protein